MSKSLVIVESPAKAKTIAGYLGKGFVVESSIGHIRDLPRNASDVPAAHKKTSWGRLGVDVDNDFKPLYVVDSEKKAHIKKLKGLLKDADVLYLATDEDREGESIAWHLLEVLKPKVPVKRMVFHEITKSAIQKALDEPRELDTRLVDAQEARRILDRLYGYEVSPVLWKKVLPKLSAGRVQSVATRIIVVREGERMRFTSVSYWGIEAKFQTKDNAPIDAVLQTVDGKRLATGKDFDENGKLTKPALLVLDEKRATALGGALGSFDFQVKSVETKPNRRSPSPPFMTSTLQQEAGRKLRYSSARTMRAAQQLYEAGHITYMRTDSTTLSGSAIAAARAQIEQKYGKEYLPEKPRSYKKKVKNAQEAHEAIRPAGDRFKLPAEVAKDVSGDEARLYELIWMRTVASQMQDARGESVKAMIVGTDGKEFLEFAASGNTILFPGFLRAYVEGSDDPDADLGNRERHLPKLAAKDPLSGERFEPKGHETAPPARYTEASLVRRLEELGVGRPSTYASIIGTILRRGYVWKKGSALVPSFTAFAVIALLEKHFGRLVDYEFTAKMEDELDEIAGGKQEATPWLHRFYFGTGGPTDSDDSIANDAALGLQAMVANRIGEIDARAVNSISLGVDADGKELLARVGRYGAYLQRGEDTVSIADEIAPDELNVEKVIELLDAPSGDRELGPDPESGLPVLLRNGRFGSYVQLGELELEPQGKGKAKPKPKNKPKTGSLLKSMDPATMTLEDALKVLALPRVVGVDPADEKKITAQLGRYGPYITKGTDSRSLEAEEDVFSVDLTKALFLFSQPRQRGRGAPKKPIKEVGLDGVSGKMITLREGRFGPYVTDGEINASLRKGDEEGSLTLERAEELLEMRRERGPVTRKKKKKVTKKKASKRKATAKKASKKKVTKKKAVAKKAVSKKAVSKKAVSKKAGPKSAVAKKATKKKASKKKTSKKKTSKKSAGSASASV